MGEFKIILNATIAMYADCVKNATLGFVRNWPVLIAAVAMFFLFVAGSRLFGSLGMAGGFIIGIISSLFTSHYYSLLSATVDKDRITRREIYQFDAGMFFSVIGISFILFIVYTLISPMAYSSESAPLVYLIYLFIVFAFNALPEVTYIHRYESLQAFTEALKFTKENWIEWYLPFILLLLPVLFLLLDPIAVLMRFALVSPLFPGIIILSTWAELLSTNPYIGILIGFLMSHWFMLFRGFLFKELSSGSRRRRVYLARQK